MNARVSMAAIAKAINSLSPSFSLKSEGDTATAIKDFSTQLGLVLPDAYKDFLATFGAVPGLKLLREASFSIAAVLDGLGVEGAVCGELLPIAYEPTFMNPEFITLGLGPLAGAMADDPRVFFTYADGLSQGYAGRLIGSHFTRFVAVGIAEWMVCPSFKYVSRFTPEISMKYVQACKVVDVDRFVGEILHRLGYRQILDGASIPVYGDDEPGGAAVVYNRCPRDYVFTLSIGAHARGATARVRDAIAAALKTGLDESL